MTDESDIEAVAARVRSTIGDDAEVWPGGYPDEIEAALLDAIFSVRARYGSRKNKTGVYGAVYRWREHRGERVDDLSVLAAADPRVLMDVTNRGKISRRRKVVVAIEAAASLIEAGITTAADFRAEPDTAGRAYLRVKGCGHVTLTYLRMLLDVDDVKADTWVIRYVEAAVGSPVSPSAAAALVKAVAGRLQVQERDLDHAIWAYQRKQG